MLRTVSTINVFVNRFEDSVQFYQEKLQLPMQFKGQQSAQFILKNVDLNVEYVDPKNVEQSKSQVGRFVGINFDVRDLTAAMKELKERGVEFAGEPEPLPGGGLAARFFDPDRNCFSLVQY